LRFAWNLPKLRDDNSPLAAFRSASDRRVFMSVGGFEEILGKRLQSRISFPKMLDWLTNAPAINLIPPGNRRPFGSWTVVFWPPRP
jgi:hypothetical protein